MLFHPPSVAPWWGVRVPALVISPYAKKLFVDHQTLSFDVPGKFTSRAFVGSQHPDPATDGRWDPRPTVRENVSILGDLAKDFDFTQAPRPPWVRPVHPATTLVNRVPWPILSARDTGRRRGDVDMGHAREQWRLADHGLLGDADQRWGTSARDTVERRHEQPHPDQRP